MGYRKYKHIKDLFEKGELIRIIKTGEVFTYNSAEAGANFSSDVVVSVDGTLVNLHLMQVHQVQKVDSQGALIDGFDRYR